MQEPPRNNRSGSCQLSAGAPADTKVNLPLALTLARIGVTGEQYLTGQGGFLFTKLFVNDKMTQTGFISSAQLTDEENDQYLKWAEELEITVERRIVYDDPYYKNQPPVKEYVEWWEQPTITPVELP